MTRYLPQMDPTISSLSNSSDVLTAQMAQLNLITNGNNSNDNQQQQGQDMNLLMNTLLMMPFWSNMCPQTISMPALYPNGVTTTQNKNIGTTNGA
jgi:hypothetical protein